MREYEVVLGGVETTVLLSDDEAKARGLTPVKPKATPEPKARTAHNKARTAENK